MSTPSEVLCQAKECLVPANPDVSGIGTRVSIYALSLLFTFLCSLRRNEANEAWWTSGTLCLSLLIASLSQKANISYYHARYAYNLSALPVVAASFTPPADIDRSPSTRLILRIIPTFVASYGFYLEVKWRSFGEHPECNSCYPYYYYFTGPHHKSETQVPLSDGIIPYLSSRLPLILQAIFCVWQVLLVVFQNHILRRAIPALFSARARERYYAEARIIRRRSLVILLRARVLRNRGPVFFLNWILQWIMYPDNLDRPRIRVLPGVIVHGAVLLVIRLFLYAHVVYDLEKTIRANSALVEIGDEQQWQFGQVFSMLSVFPALVILARIFTEHNDANTWDKDQLETDEQKATHDPFDMEPFPSRFKLFPEGILSGEEWRKRCNLPEWKGQQFAEETTKVEEEQELLLPPARRTTV